MAEGNFNIATNVEESYVGDFKELILSMRKLNRQLDGTLHSIVESSEQVKFGAEQLAQSAQALAEGATEQAGAIEELTATVESVTGISEQSLENATSAANSRFLVEIYLALLIVRGALPLLSITLPSAVLMVSRRLLYVPGGIKA